MCIHEILKELVKLLYLEATLARQMTHSSSPKYLGDKKQEDHLNLWNWDHTEKQQDTRPHFKIEQLFQLTRWSDIKGPLKSAVLSRFKVIVFP